MDVAMAMKLPTICAVSLPCHMNPLEPYALSPGPNAPNSQSMSDKDKEFLSTFAGWFGCLMLVLLLVMLCHFASKLHRFRR
ncbi:hypothetical protein TSUD_207640 [Trifolium subterraneum]|uniref:Uncharacterized protein n=1 Tax=Trifolium subterraneum TaxID=3900 RepID=A0A2Z6NHQ9_TRISU|nr:hypothetical protein TSUD_207640 [Trifolium subterraneum]